MPSSRARICHSGLTACIFGPTRCRSSYQNENQRTRAYDPYLEETSIKVRDDVGDRANRHRPDINAFKPLFVIKVPHLGPLKKKSKMPPGTGGKHAHKYSASSGGPHRRAYRRRWRPRLEAPREAVFPEGCHSRGSDATPTRAGGRSSDEPRTLEAEGAWTPRCAGANRPPDPEGSSRPGTGKRSRQTKFTHKGGLHREYLLDWEAEAHGARCDVSTVGGLGRPRHRGGDVV